MSMVEWLSVGGRRRRWLAVVIGLGAVLGLVAAACGGGEEEAPTATPGESPADSSPAPGSPTPSATPSPRAELPPLIQGFYAGEKVSYLLTDASGQADAEVLSDATGYDVAFVPALVQAPEGSLAVLYQFLNGVRGPNPFGFQADVLDSVRGDEGYSPLRAVLTVTWSDSATPRQLKSEEEIRAAEEAGNLSVDNTVLVVNAPVVESLPPVIRGFHNAESVNYLQIDTSSESEAETLSESTGFPVTAVPSLAEVPETALSKLYRFTNGVSGPNPLGFQANVLNVAPAEPGYSPLRSVFEVTWSDTAEPRELKSEAEILTAQSAGELTAEKTTEVVNGPGVRGTGG